MKISFDKKTIIDKFLTPISRISEECSIKLTKDYLYSLVNDLSGNIILYCKLVTPMDVTNPLSLNIKDVRKLSKVFDCINSSIIDIDLDENASVLKYKSPEVSFKLHLVTDNVIRKCTINLEKINKLTYNSSFDLSGEKLNELLKGSIFSTETNKLYFYTQDNKVFAELTDKASQDTDSITFIITNNLEGELITTPLPFSMEVLRLLAISKPTNIKVKINNTYKIISFNIITSDSEMLYIIPAYVK